MGKWSQKEYDRQLYSKIKRLFFEDALLDKPEDPRFRTFVQQLDPENKQIQACFRSLVQQMTYDSKRRRERQPSRRRNPRYIPPPDPRSPRLDTGVYAGPGVSWIPPFPTYPLEDDDEDAGFSVFEPLSDAPYRADLDELPLEERLSRPTRFVPYRPASYPPNRPMSPDPIGLTDGTEEDAGSLSARRRSATPLSGRRRSFSPSFSPSRVRTFEAPENNVVAEGSQGQDRREPTPPRSPSRAWLEEYSRNRPAAAPEDQGGILDPILDRLRDRNRNLHNTLNTLRRTHSQYLRGGSGGDEDDMDDSARRIRRLRRRILHRSDEEDGTAPTGGPVAADMARSAPSANRQRDIEASPEHDYRRDGVVFEPDFLPFGALSGAEVALADNDSRPDPEGFGPWTIAPTEYAAGPTRGGSVAIGQVPGRVDEEEDGGMLAMDPRGYITVVPRPTGEAAEPSII